MKKYLLLLPLFFVLRSNAQATWAQDVAPILYARCTGCHHPGGLAPFSLMTYADAFTHSYHVEHAVHHRTMPPWPPDFNYKRYVHERVLDQSEIDAINDWALTGKQQGDMAEAPSAPIYNNGSQLGTVDLTVKIPTYTVGSNNDVYRNFPIPSGLLQSKNVIAFEVIPGNPRIVHHVLVFHDSTNVPAQLDANDPGPGYTNVGFTGSAASVLIGGYTPGASPYYTPVGTGFRLAANTNIVIQVHYPAGSMGMVDSTRINFKLTTSAVRQISVWPLLNHLTSMTNGPINIPPNQTRTYYEQFTTNAKYTFLSALPHMHLIGTSFKTWANQPSTNDTIRFVNIPVWDFHWQDTYVFPNSVIVPSGSTLRAVATYDNTINNFSNPNNPPQTVLAGESTNEEMMMVFFAYMPYQTGDENIIIDRRIIPQGATTFCNGQSVALKTIEGAGYTYQWYKNGAIINGETSYSYVANQAGNYHVLITLGPNQAYSDTVAIAVSSPPPANIAPASSTTICQGASVTLQANAGSGYSYQWFNGANAIANATSQSYAAIATGNYSVQVYNGCYTGSTPVSVTAIAPPPATITPLGSTEICPGGVVILSAPFGYSYQWNDGSIGQYAAASQAATYSVTVSDIHSCSSTASLTTTFGSSPTVTVTPSGPLSFCPGQSINLSGPLDVDYSWSTGANTQSIIVSQTGTYTLTITDAYNCSGVSSAITITVHPLPNTTITPSGATAFCQGQSINLSAVQGYSYSWSTGAAAQSITVNQSGSYRVTVTDVNNCSAISSYTTTIVNPLPTATITPAGNTTICQGKSVSLSAPANMSYSWSNNGNTQSISATQAGSYNVTVADANNCTAAATAVLVTVNPLPTVSITAGGATSFCPGGSVLLSSSNAPGYLWSTGVSTQSITATTSGNYAVTVTDANNCSNAATQTVTVYPVPSALITSDKPTTICPGDTVTLSAPAGMSYQWSNGASSQNIRVAQNGTFSVIVTDNHTCTASSSSINVTLSNNAVAGITPSSATAFCDGGNVTLIASAGTVYHWSDGTSLSSINVNASGTYTVTVTISANCTAVSNPIDVVVHPNPSTPTITAGGSTTVCQGESVNLTAPGNLNYIWSNGDTLQTIAAIQSGSYSVTIADVNNCTAVSSPLPVTVNPLPSVNISATGATSFCDGESVTLNSNAGTDYLWSTGAITQSITTNTAGSYHLTLTDANNCSNTTTQTVTVYNLPDATVTTDKPTSICPGDSVTLSAPSGLNYQWSNTASLQNITVLQSGTFTVTVTDANNCTAVSSPVSIVVSNNATASITPATTTTFCIGGSVKLTASPGTSYLWSNGANTATTTIYSSGTYTVSVTVSANCTAVSNPITVMVNQNPAPPAITASSNVICGVGNAQLSSTAGYSSYHWSNGDTGQIITVSTAGSFSVSVTDANACSASSTAITITVEPLPAVTLTGNADTVCSNSSQILLSGGSPAGGTFSGPGITGNSFNPSATGTGTHTIAYSYTDNNGCVNTANEAIVVQLCTGLSEILANNIRIYPNPSTGEFTIDLGNWKTELMGMKLFELSGQLVYAKDVTGGEQNRIILSDLSAGTYIIELKGSNDIYHQRLLIEK